MSSAERCTLQEIFQAGFDEFARSRELHAREWRAANCIRYCYTDAMGSHTEACAAGDYSKLQFHACRHRSCPRCADSGRARWIDAQMQRLLPCSHFHVIFTWPHSLMALWEHNRASCIGLLFDCARQALLQLLADKRHLGATPGLLMSLHTWGRTLSHHPHLHCLVSAGGIDEQGQWRASRANWLVPQEPLKRLFRGKLLQALWAALERNRLQLPAWSTNDSWQQQIKRLYRKHWNLEIRPMYDTGRGVLLYLGRYAKGGPLRAKQPLRMDGTHVSFEYKDHRDGQRKTMKLPKAEFISRVLWHAAPRGVHTTRHAGLYSSSHREQHQQALDALTQADRDAPARWPRPPRTPAPVAPARCPNCRGPLLRLGWKPRRLMLSAPVHHNGEISLSIATRATGPPLQDPRGPMCGPTGRSNGHASACHPGLAAERGAHCPPPGQGGMPMRAA